MRRAIPSGQARGRPAGAGGRPTTQARPMSEPRAKAKAVEPVVPGVWGWHVRDHRLSGARSDAFAVVDEGRVVLVDPLPIEEDALRALGDVEAIVLTAANHQRSAWRLRKAFGARVYAPDGAEELEEPPDHSYSGGDLLPGGLTAFHAPGPTEAMYALWKSRPVGVVFLSDLLTHDGSGRLSFVPARFQDAPARTRASVARVLDDLPFVAACFAHGPPLVGDARKAMRRALEEDAEALPGQPSP